MSVPFEATVVASWRRTAPFANHINKASLLVAVAILAAGCASRTAVPLVGPDPSDASVPVARTGYRSALGDYRTGRPVGPSSWIEQNQRVAPAPKEK